MRGCQIITITWFCLQLSCCDLQVLVDEGKIRHVGLSEVGPDQIRAAAAVVPITAIEQEWSLFVRDLEVRLCSASLALYV
jgi:aryl-alcohol dehydrogenase-like predicted oxidoreductase